MAMFTDFYLLNDNELKLFIIIKFVHYTLFYKVKMNINFKVI
jgi:hypothetical protein